MRYLRDFATLILLSLLCLSVPSCEAVEYYVKPTQDTPCPQPCHTLVEYAENASYYFKSAFNVTVLFLPGIHLLNQTLAVSNATNVSFQSISSFNVGGSNTTIQCNNHGSFQFANTSNLTIEHLNFSQCGIPCQSQSCWNDHKWCAFTSENLLGHFGCAGSMMLLTNIANLRIVGVTIEKGWPIFGKNVVGHSEIADLTVTDAAYTTDKCWNWAVSFFFDDTLPSSINRTESNHLVIQDSHVHDSAYGAICVSTKNITYSIEVDIVQVCTGTNGRFTSILQASDIYVYLATTSSVIRINDSHLANGSGSAIYIVVDTGEFSRDTQNTRSECSSDTQMKGQVHTSGCNITGYNTTALVIAYPYTYKNKHTVTVVDSVVASNHWTFGDYSNTGTSAVLVNAQASVTFANTLFEDNVSKNPAVASTVTLNSANNVNFINCNFTRNTGTAISAFNSTFHVSGNMSFTSNSGKQGGAMAFYDNSMVIVDNNTLVLFHENSALVGGGIFVGHGYDLLYSGIFNTLCFFRFVCGCYAPSLVTSANVSFKFINNTAQYGGNAIYGASLDTCLVDIHTYGSQVILNPSISHFDPCDNLSTITSLPSRVCLCISGKPDCTSNITRMYPQPLIHYPGQSFEISAAVVGDHFGTVSGSVYAQFLILNHSRTDKPQIEALQEVQRVHQSHCTNLTYSVLSENQSEIIVLTATETSVDSFADQSIVANLISELKAMKHITWHTSPLLSFPVYLNITLRPCPPGFTIASPPGKCVCTKQVEENDITCNITDQTLHRSGTIWISASTAKHGVIIAKHCPYHYCRPEEVAVNLSSPDSQCDFDHSGTLCGGCQPGLSLALGSSQCLPCSDKYLALILPFALAGIVLVFFIRLLVLTVSKGTINGLIFYANIVGALPSTFFPAGDRSLLTVFIAWLNLDLGFETCFINGLNAYWKTWLQFVFPAYIWAIIGLIIMLLQVSKIVRKLFGNHSTDIVATLLFLSYTKLLRTIIIALSLTYLEQPDGSRVAVWSPDGNISYLSGKHIPLFLVALAVLLLLWLPFTVILLFWQILQRITHYGIVRWIVIKQKPFFDTYFGPLKDEHRYWVGALLLIRGIHLAIFATSTTTVSLLSIATTAICLLAYGANLPHKQQKREGKRASASSDLTLFRKFLEKLSTFTGSFYKNWYLSLLENSFILNLGVLSAATLYVDSSNGNQAAVVYTSVGIAFAQFVGIVSFHASRVIRKWLKNCMERIDEVPFVSRTEYEIISDESALTASGRFAKESFSQYREPLLEYFDD